MLNTDDYIPKLSNREKIKKLNDKIVINELKIEKNESKRLIINQCVAETQNKLDKLQNKVLLYPDNEKIADEIENSSKRIREGKKILENLNEKLLHQEIALVKLRQKQKAEIKSGLVKYLDEINSNYEKILQDEIKDKQDNEKENELEKLEREIEHIKQLIR